MIRIQNFTKATILLVTVLGLFSCNDDDNVEAFSVIGDVFTTKRMIDNEVQYARSYYAYGNQPMSVAKATTPDADEIVLSALNAAKNTWAKDASINDFSTDIPSEGNYQFDVLHEDVPHESFDILNFNDLDFSTINSATMENFTLTVEWSGATESEGYMLRLLSSDDVVVFASQLLPSSATKLVIAPNTASGSWLDGYPKQSETYKLELHSFLFDSDATELDYTYNIEEISITADEIVWE